MANFGFDITGSPTLSLSILCCSYFAIMIIFVQLHNWVILLRNSLTLLLVLVLSTFYSR